MEPAVVAILCLIGGLLLIAAEFLLPSGGLIGLLASLAIVFSLYEAWTAFGSSRPGLFYTFVLLTMFSVPGVIALMFQALKKTKRAEHLFLTPPDDDDLAPFAEESDHMASLIGRFGVAVSDLRPAGIAKVDGERLDVVSDGSYVESGTPVKVIAIRGVFPVVRGVDPDEIEGALQAKPAPPADAIDDPVDEPPSATEPPARPSDDYADPFADEA